LLYKLEGKNRFETILWNTGYWKSMEQRGAQSYRHLPSGWTGVANLVKVPILAFQETFSSLPSVSRQRGPMQ
jgi:hypothetical protein